MHISRMLRRHARAAADLFKVQAAVLGSVGHQRTAYRRVRAMQTGQAAAMGRYRARKRGDQPTTRERCGATFTPPRSDARYCSSACRQAAYRERKAASQ